VGTPTGDGSAKASVGVEETLMDEDADAGVGPGEYAHPDQTGVDADDIGGD